MSPLLIFIACIAHQLHVTLAKTVRTPQEDHEKNNLFELLASIDKRLAKLDEGLHTVDVAGGKFVKLETTLKQYGENLEESYVKNSNEIVTRVDTLCERTQHRLMHLEMRIESAEKKLSEKMDILMARFEKMEDTLTTRESDIEEQIGEVLSAVEELKIPTDSSATDSVVKRNTEALLEANEKLEEIKASLQTREEIGEEIHADVKQMANVLNSTRNEQRNSFRNVVVQVGRIGGKNSICNPNSEIDQLRDLNETIHASLENVVALQNLFLESCHRIQLDEEQIEEKISEVLEKLIEALQQQDFEKNLKSIEQLIKVHDANTRRNMLSNLHNIGVQFQKDKKSKDEQKIQLEKVTQIVEKLEEKTNNLCTSSAGKVLERIDNTTPNNKK